MAARDRPKDQLAARRLDDVLSEHANLLLRQLTLERRHASTPVLDLRDRLLELRLHLIEVRADSAGCLRVGEDMAAAAVRLKEELRIVPTRARR